MTQPAWMASDAMALVRSRAKEMEAALREAMSPAGALNLPPLLDEKRLQHLIPDEAFRLHAAYDRVLVYQLDPFGDRTEEEMEKAYGSMIIMPEQVRADAREAAPRGLIISAGLEALDNLRSNGMDVGHTILVAKYSPYRWVVPYGTGGRTVDVLILRDGDVCGSEDTARLVKEGKLRIEWHDVREKDVNGKEVTTKRHFWKNTETGEVWTPTNPWIAEDN